MLIKPKFSVFLVVISFIFGLAFPQFVLAGFYGEIIESYFLGVKGLFDEAQIESEIPKDDWPTLHGRALIQPAYPYIPIVISSRWVIITAYSSTVDQTDSTPFITASGTRVQEGVIACNFLKFGTLVRFPEIYGDKVFIVEDRMARKNNHKMDIWFPTRWQALDFGVKRLRVEILQS